MHSIALRMGHASCKSAQMSRLLVPPVCGVMAAYRDRKGNSTTSRPESLCETRVEADKTVNSQSCLILGKGGPVTDGTHTSGIMNWQAATAVIGGLGELCQFSPP